MRASTGTSNWDDNDDLIVTDSLIQEPEGHQIDFSQMNCVERTNSPIDDETSDSSSDSSTSTSSLETVVENEQAKMNVSEVRV